MTLDEVCFFYQSSVVTDASWTSMCFKFNWAHESARTELIKMLEDEDTKSVTDNDPNIEGLFDFYSPVSILTTELSSISPLLSTWKEEAQTCKELLFHLGLFGWLCSVWRRLAEETTEPSPSAQMTRLVGITGSRLMDRGCAFTFDVRH